MAPTGDALLALRRSIFAKQPAITTLTPPNDAQPGQPEADLSVATHLHFPHSSQTFAFSSPTRVVINDETVDLRSIYFMWQKNDISSVDYGNACQALTDELQREGRAGGRVRRILFGEKADIIAWLEGADDCQYIVPLSPEAQREQDELDQAGAAVNGAPAVQRPAQGLAGVGIDPKLKGIYNGERRMGDRNSVLRGVKPTDFSHIRKHAEVFLGKSRNPRSGLTQPKASPLVQRNGKPTAPAGSSTQPSRSNREPIILLSPSASSLLRMSNIKSFLDGGIYTPADSASAASNINHISRLLPSVDPQRPFRFILVDSADQFKPDYWNRVVAVFTTGQLWQFKGYLWQSPPDLFSHALGIFVGWRGEDVPGTVKGWGRGVMSTQIDKFNPNQGAQARWRDREVVEGIWTAVEESMRTRGWGKDLGR